MSPREIAAIAPPTPACFPDRETWVGYLVDCQRDRRASLLPFSKNGIYKPAWSFCSDCTSGHAAAMRSAGKCRPESLRVVIPIVKETVCN
jgi:hypothetical protein